MGDRAHSDTEHGPTPLRDPSGAGPETLRALKATGSPQFLFGEGDRFAVRQEPEISGAHAFVG